MADAPVLTMTPLQHDIVRVLLQHHDMVTVANISDQMGGGIRREIEEACTELMELQLLKRGKINSGETRRRAYKLSPEFRQALKRRNLEGA